MSMPFTRAPHRGDAPAPMAPSAAPNAALLIDFDNVTMGMRSDLSKDLRKLLESDIIKGKVTVQRAYADWRRYPQYIVPLSENSIDLIFAPAYGSSKKNATDIRMAIDAMELVFVRPEIGTFILLTGDSDFSSCVLKLKEYGKYVIGVGIQESSSDILVQNCDEYYSYTGLTGLTKTTGGDQSTSDPWVLVDKAIRRMRDRDDVMRSDRLKQVMMELDPNFDEGSFGFSKFSRFLTEAASKGLVDLRKMDNGQYEISLPSGKSSGGGGRSRRDDRKDDRRDRSRGRDRSSGRGRDGRADRRGRRSEEPEEGGGDSAAGGGDPLQDAYGLLVRSLEALRDDGRHPVRDSDVKRKMLEFRRGFDEGELGFPKFSRFLQQADEHGVVSLRKEEGGNYEVALPEAPGASAPQVDTADDRGAADHRGDDGATAETGSAPESRADDGRAPAEEVEEAEVVGGGSGPVVRELRPEDVVDPDAPGRRLGPRGGTTRRRGGDDEPPPLLPGQAGAAARSGSGPDSSRAASGDASSDDVDMEELGLPTDPDSQLRYLSNSYRGVGKKTAEALIENFGEDLFSVLHSEPDRVRSVVPPNRADAVLEAWAEDYARRSAGGNGSDGAGGRDDGRARGRSRRGRRGRGGGTG